MAIARDFTSGPILRAIVNLALPIMGTAFIQMGYNLADVFGLGRKGVNLPPRWVQPDSLFG